MKRMLIVSNRLPVAIKKKEDGMTIQSTVGGLATGLQSFYQSYDSIWIGWCGISSDNLTSTERTYIQETLMGDFRNHSVFLSSEDIASYYLGFCNNTIWPLFHYFTNYAVYDEAEWRSYENVNRLFCDAIAQVAHPGDIIWLHDYHLMLLPSLLRQRLPDATIGFFLHIPFPSSEIYRTLPWRKEILEGLLGADLIGFHTFDYVRHFLSAVRQILGFEHNLGNIFARERVIKVDAFPMGIDYEKYEKAPEDPAVKEDIEKILERTYERKIILSIDRLDYTKGILHRLEAFDHFLDNNPEYTEKVVLILSATPSRVGVETYQLLKRQLDEKVGRINGDHGTIGWVPVWYQFKSHPFHTLIALYRSAHVALVTPLRDGMNLIAKEFIATKSDGRGVLILSELAGAARELGESLVVNPNNKEEVADAIKRALCMSEEEQIERNRRMQDRIRRYNVTKWAQDFIDKLFEIKTLQEKRYAKLLTLENMRDLIQDFDLCQSRLILLDYDGTLISFVDNPEEAVPDEELLHLLESLSSNPRTTVVIISGRPRETLEKWFGDLPLDLVAEHGAWIRKKGEWNPIEPMVNTWKEQIRPIIEVFVDRTPGSFLEEKDFSLVFHYRKTEPSLAMVRMGELKDALIDMTSNLNLSILEGNKVIEIKNSGVGKGRAALRWISGDQKEWDFIMAAGDDWTDEDLFEVLPDSAYSIRIGLGHSHARFNLNSVQEMRLLLRELVRVSP
ncbi:MAG: bifunctional alpha,alpha-trehalose-phosphate synthase (UDP-forming)/trehalose-phosphatase [Theionarchaea archaeon]|nr:bifunctional alpha,alpha-trehalose-phosphate synthase (UDP-forming)/trehalose-phosphatase [Theionarchaea archaeon]